MPTIVSLVTMAMVVVVRALWERCVAMGWGTPQVLNRQRSAAVKLWWAPYLPGP